LRTNLLKDLAGGVISNCDVHNDTLAVLPSEDLKNVLSQDLTEFRKSCKVDGAILDLNYEESSFEDISVSGYSTTQFVEGETTDLLNFKLPDHSSNENENESSNENENETQDNDVVDQERILASPSNTFERRRSEKDLVKLLPLPNPLTFHTPRDRSKTLCLVRGDSKGVQFEQEGRWFFRVKANLPVPRPYQNVQKVYRCSAGTHIDFSAKYAEGAKDLNDFSLASP